MSVVELDILAVLSEDEALGLEIYKMHNWRGRGAREIIFEIVGFTRPAVTTGVGFIVTQGYGSPADMDRSERAVARTQPGVLLKRIDDNSASQMAGSIEWKISKFLEPDRLRSKGFRVRRKESQ